MTIFEKKYLIKKIKLFVIAILTFVSCDQNSKNIQKMEIPTNGFFASSDHQVMMGSSATVEIFKKLIRRGLIETIKL